MSESKDYYISKILAILFLMFTACGKVYENADVYIKTIKGYEYTCKNCDVYLGEAVHWDDDMISVIKYTDNYATSEEFETRKSKIEEIRIKLNHPGSK